MATVKVKLTAALIAARVTEYSILELDFRTHDTDSQDLDIEIMGLG